jgi:hypothetical protein
MPDHARQASADRQESVPRMAEQQEEKSRTFAEQQERKRQEFEQTLGKQKAGQMARS